MKFIHISDTNVRKEYSQDLTDASLQGLVNPKKNMKHLLKNVSWQDVDFAIFTGDLVHEGTKEDYTYFKKLVKKNIPSSIKVLYVLGNHDKKEAFYSAFYEKKSNDPYYYTEEIDGYRIIVLDSAVPLKEAGTINKEQLNWLKNILSQPSPKGSIVFLHHPIFWNTKDEKQIALTNGPEVLQILENSDTFVIFCGHTHMNAVNIRGKLVQYTADSLGYTFEMPIKKHIAMNDKVGYSIVNVQGQDVFTHFEKCYKAKNEIRMPLHLFVRQLQEMNEQEKKNDSISSK